MENLCEVRLVIINEFGNQTDVAVAMPDSTIVSVYNAIRNALLASEFNLETVDTIFPYMEELETPLNSKGFRSILKRI